MNEFQLYFQEMRKDRDYLLSLLQVTIDVLKNMPIPYLDPDGNDCTEATLKLIAKDLEKAINGR